MKVVTVVGARPQFIKAAPVSRALRRRHTEVLVHTGQHYDAQLSDVFFSELGIPAPDHALAVGSGPHGQQTARMLEAIERLLLREQPDGLLVYGDTNSTLAGAMAAVKLAIPVVHVEAGLRSFNRTMPEETNRVLTDHMSTLLCCTSDVAVRNLMAEGIQHGVTVVGDVMLDSLLETAERLRERQGSRRRSHASPFVLVTVHRPVNTDSAVQLRGIVDALASLDQPVRWPMHPRTRAALATHRIAVPPSLQLCDPLGYGDLVRALEQAPAVITDSGGLQKEAYWMGVPCFTLRDETEWVETVQEGWNTLVRLPEDNLAQLVSGATRPATARDAYGSRGAAERIIAAIEDTFGTSNARAA